MQMCVYCLYDAVFFEEGDMDKLLEYVANSANSGEFWYLCYLAIGLHVFVSIAIAFSSLGKVTIVRNADSLAECSGGGSFVVKILPHLIYVLITAAAAIVLSSISSRIDEDSIYYYYRPAVFVVYFVLLVIVEIAVRLFQYKVNGYVDTWRPPAGTGGGMFSSLVLVLFRADTLLNLMLRIIAKMVLAYKEVSRSSEGDHREAGESDYISALNALERDVNTVKQYIKRMTDDANRLNAATPPKTLRNGKIVYFYSWSKRRASS